MTIAFLQFKWNKIKQDAAKWWAGELGRPLIFVSLVTEKPHAKNKLPSLKKYIKRAVTLLYLHGYGGLPWQ